MSNPSRRLSALCACLALAACSPLAGPPPAQPQASAAPAPAATARAAPDWQASGARLLYLAPQESLLTITVRRGGALARLGHDHVIASRTLQGAVAPALGRAEFRFRLDEMSVDESGLRAAAGLTTTPSAEAIAGTRRNMLARVLDAERYPWVRIEARRDGGAEVLDADITLHGVTRRVKVPAHITEAADGRSLQASGTLRLKQSDFGIVPFAILGGAMAVQDEMELAFRITAVAHGSDGASATRSGAAPAR